MSTNLHRVLENTRWRLEALTPSHGFFGIGFRSIDPTIEPPENTSGWVRSFFVHWSAASEENGATDLDTREAPHTLTLHVIYPTESLPYSGLEAMVLQDRHDIVKEMRDQSKRVGYDSSHTTADIGLMFRRKVGTDRLIAGGPLIPGFVSLPSSIFQLTMDLTCEVREEE